jgi:hypothetical protein
VLVVVGVVLGAGRRVGEPPVGHAPGRTGDGRGVPGEGDPETGLPQRLTEFRDDLGGAVGEPVEDAQQPGTDVLAGRSSRRRVMSGQPEQMVAFVQREMQTLGDGGDQAFRGERPAFLLEPAVVVGGDVTESSDFFAAKPCGPPPLPAGKTDVLGLQQLPTATQELGKARSIDHVCFLQ